MNHTGENPKQFVVAIVPARFNSTRLPGKALLDIGGKPMICWVVERALEAKSVSRAIVATDDRRIMNAVQKYGYESIETSADHKTGTDRIAEVARALTEAEIIVNVQGDEPLISPLTIDLAVDALRRSASTDLSDEVGIATTWEPITCASDVLNPDVVKIACDEASRAVYFSRSPVPFPREAVREHGTIQAALANDASLVKLFRKHTGLYAYRRDVLLEFTSWPQSELERAESLEQLRALEHGVKIRAVEAKSPSIGVDTLEDLERVRSLFLSNVGNEASI